jgi:hypothetical protein
MILLADPHPFIVQETVYASDAPTRRKSQAAAPSQAVAHNHFASVVIDSISREVAANSAPLPRRFWLAETI